MIIKLFFHKLWKQEKFDEFVFLDRMFLEMKKF